MYFVKPCENVSNFTCTNNTIINCFCSPKSTFGIKTKWDILDQSTARSLLEMDKSWKNFHLWWKPEIGFLLCFTREEKASDNVSEKLQRKWNTYFCMQLLLRYKYLATKRETAAKITSINEYMFKNKGMLICLVLCCTVVIAILRTDVFPFYSWENFTKYCWEVKPKYQKKEK